MIKSGVVTGETESIMRLLERLDGHFDSGIKPGC